MRFFFFLAVIAAGLIWGSYFMLTQVGLIDGGCPSVSAQGGQIVVDNQLSVDLRVRLHDATPTELRVKAKQCVVVDIVRLKVALEAWPYTVSGMPNCVTNMLPAQAVSIYDRGGMVYCDVGRAEIDLKG